jgi:hypothetical protein
MNPSIDFHAYRHDRSGACCVAVNSSIHFVHTAYVKAGGAEVVHTDTTERAQPLGED